MAGKGGLMIALDLGKKKPKDDERAEGETTPEEDALADFFDKGSAGDYAGASEALKSYMGICYPKMGMEHEEGEASEEA